MFWILLWLAISIGLGVMFFMALGINVTQVRAWRSFSEKTGLQFYQENMVSPPSFSGVFQGYDLRAYTAIENNMPLRNKDIWTFFEVDLKAKPETDFIVSKSDYQGTLHKDTREKFELDGIYTAVCEAASPAKAAKFFTEKRMKHVKELWEIEEVDPLIMNNEVACTVIVRTHQPLSHPKELNKFVKQLIAQVRKVDLRETKDNGSKAGNIN